MWAAVLGGARAAMRRGALVIALWLIGAGFGAAFALAAALWLGLALEGSLATRTLLQHIDADVLVDLWFHHRESLAMLAVGAAGLTAVHVMLWWWLDGVIVAALAGRSGSPWRAGFGLAPVMAQLYLIAIAIMTVWTAAIGGATWAAVRATRESPDAYLWGQLIGGALLLWALGMVVLIAIHDHARLRAGLAGAGAATSWRWATAFVLVGGERAIPLAFLLQVSALLLYAAYRTASLAVPLTELIGLTGSLLLGELFLLARTWVRVWFLAAQRELHA